jgi:hypothetical protein
MDTPHLRWRAAVAGCLAAVVVSSCSSAPAAAPGADPSRPAAPAPRSASTPPQASLPDANGRACIGVEAILAHITVDTARWSPTVHPFDQSVAARLADQTRYLDRQALAAGLTVRRAVAATASAFGGVAEAIMARSRPRLDRAIARSRTAYSGLKKACHLHG